MWRSAQLHDWLVSKRSPQCLELIKVYSPETTQKVICTPSHWSPACSSLDLARPFKSKLVVRPHTTRWYSNTSSGTNPNFSIYSARTHHGMGSDKIQVLRIIHNYTLCRRCMGATVTGAFLVEHPVRQMPPPPPGR